MNKLDKIRDIHTRNPASEDAARKVLDMMLTVEALALDADDEDAEKIRFVLGKLRNRIIEGSKGLMETHFQQMAEVLSDEEVDAAHSFFCSDTGQSYQTKLASLMPAHAKRSQEFGTTVANEVKMALGDILA